MLHAVKTLGQKRSKPVGKPAELLKRARYGRKRKAEAGRKMGRRETHVLAGSNLSLHMNSLGCKCRLRGWKGLTKRQKRNLYSVHASGWEGKRMTSEKARGWRYLCSVQVRPASAAENG